MLPKALQDELVAKIVSAVDPLKIILFGSYAYGRPGKDSDIDLVIIKDKVVSKRRESSRIWKLLADIPFAKDIILASADEFEFYKNEAGSTRRVLSSGR